MYWKNSYPHLRGKLDFIKIQTLKLFYILIIFIRSLWLTNKKQ
jgi:hypothetical protein